MTARTERSGALRSLAVRNYRLYGIGQLASLCGTWMQSVAIAWLVLDLSGGGAQVGMVTAFQFGPQLLLGGVAGVLVDRLDRRRALLGAEAVMATQATILAVIVLTDVAALWMVYVLALIQGLGNAMEQPARQALLSELVGDEDLPNAISLNAALFTLSRVVGPAVAGVVISTAGTGVCFTINALSYGAIILAVLAMRADELHHRPRVARARGQLREALGMVGRTPAVRALFLSGGALGLFGQSTFVVLPLLARYEFGGSATTYGVMAAATALGGCVAAFGLASLSAPTDRRIMLAALLLGVSLAATALAPTLALALVALPFAGLFQLAQGVSTNAAVQLRTPPEMRGRVIALYFSLTAGAQAAGAPLMGAVSEAFNPRWALGLGAAVGFSTFLAWSRRAARVTKELQLAAEPA